MVLELRQLRCLVAVVETGTFTDAAIELGVSQAAVSRTILSLEAVLGARLLDRTSRSCAPTAAGARILVRARNILAEADILVLEAAPGKGQVRIGHAWSAFGRHTPEFQRRWAQRHPAIELRLIRTNTATAGLAEGACDIAVVRTGVSKTNYARAIVGHERRYCAMAADDPLAKRRSLALNDFCSGTVLIDRRTGTTTPGLWPPELQPNFKYIRDVDDWLAEIASGRSVGITAESTMTQYRRMGVVFRPVRDAPPVAVQIIWHRDDPHEAAQEVAALLRELYGGGPRQGA